MAAPRCPQHNVEMVLKTAKKGRNAGGRFWGCPTWSYTKCRHTLPFEEQSSSESADAVPSVDAVPSKLSLRSLLPRSLRARTRFQGFQVRFLDSAALPVSILEAVIDGELEEDIVRAFSQWRLDYPASSHDPVWTEKETQVLSVAEKLLTRGRLTLCSPTLEEEYRGAFFGEDEETKPLRLTKELLFNSIPNIHWDFWLDSPAEKTFYSVVVPIGLGSHFQRWVLPQVEITSLLPANSTSTISGRVDFLICCPSLQPLVVEIDGEQHKNHRDADGERDLALTKEGYRVLRIPSAEIESLTGENLTTLGELLIAGNKTAVGRSIYEESVAKFIHACKTSHQIQIAILQAVESGFLQLDDLSRWSLTTDLESIGLFSQEEASFVLASAVADLQRLLANIVDLYSLPTSSGQLRFDSGSASNSLHISFLGQAAASSPTFFVQDISVPFHIAQSGLAASPAILNDPSPQTLEYLLNYIFRKPSFWEGQVDAITRSLQRKDSIVLLPTGAGKSIAFQLASFLLTGRAVIIEPIISLMEDQIDNLQSVGIDRAVAITSQITDPQDRTTILSLFGQGEYLLAYVSPERFQITEFREALRALTVHSPISLIAVDEAHCISEWGHDFRTAYLNIGKTTRRYCESNGVIPPLLALTGTASRSVLKDVQRELQIEEFDALITPNSFDRPELRFEVVRSSSAEKTARLLGFLGQSLPSLFHSSSASFFQSNGKSTFSGLVFCPHVNGGFGVVAVADEIKTKLNVSAAIYSGKEPKLFSQADWGFAKRAVARQFKHNKIPLLVCTKAFGMGIDKPNIRFTVHFGMPSSLESFYQEAGRAGRDRKTAHCCILVSDDYPERSRRLLNPNTRAEEVSRALQATSWNDDDDVTRALYFQTQAFPGAATEKARAAQVLKALPALSGAQKKSVVFPDLKRHEAEKGLHRLLILGIISDYTINYGSDEFTVHLADFTPESMITAYGNYVGGYHGGRRQVEIEKAEKLLSLPFDDFVLGMVDLLVDFIYEIVERGRRRALAEMLAATSSTVDIRQRILRYLEATEFSEGLEAILAQDNAGLDATRELFEKVRSPNEAAELRGQVSRYLESYPDHAGLLMLRALSEVFCRDKDPDIAKQNFLAAVSSAKDNYGVTGQRLFDFVIWGVAKTAESHIPLAESLQLAALKRFPDRLLARGFVKHSPLQIAVVPAWLLMGTLAHESRGITSTQAGGT